MSTMIVRPAGARGMGSWLAARWREVWRDALHTGQQRALSLGQPVLVSLTLPVEPREPVALYATISPEREAYFWEQPSSGRALVGAGVAAALQAQGEARFAATSAQWRALLRHAIIVATPDLPDDAARGPILCGGFAFDPHRPRTPLWRGFPDSLLVVPHALYALFADRATLTLSRMISGDDDTDALAAETVAWEQCPTPALSEPEIAMQVRDLRPAGEWMELVAQAARLVRDGELQKVVLARGVAAEASQPFVMAATLERLRHHYPGASIFAVRRGGKTFIGATPEQLARVDRGHLVTMALAGTAPRGATPQEDEAIGAELLASAKNHIEHSIVAETIREALALHCKQVEIAAQPHLLKLKNVQHLQTPISGELLPNRSILDVIGELHPTPAVGGAPRAAALAFIRAGEGLDRGWYAAPLGWLDAAGNGEFAVALRSALVEGAQATLFAGCGIVGESDPAGEYAESRLKLHVMLRALGEERPHPLAPSPAELERGKAL